jgi:hypothetical protein
VPAAKRRKKLAVEKHALQPQVGAEEVTAGRIVAAFEAGRSGFWLAQSQYRSF